VKLLEQSWPSVDALSRDTPVVVPIAALEQHGRHLPVFTDSLLLEEVVRRASEQLAGRVLLAPLLWLGNSHHHLDFPGTLSAEPRLYIEVLEGLVENLLVHGFRRLVLLNGHGGNIVPGEQAVFEVRQRHRSRTDLLLLFATYWTLGSRPRDAEPSFQQDAMGHACEWETSMMLRLAPELVGEYREVDDVSPLSAFAPAHRAWTTKDRSSSGHIGRPRHATAAKGETLFRLFSQDVAAFLEKVIAWRGEGWGAAALDASRRE
jgi:creatinine amidohydrolase